VAFALAIAFDLVLDSVESFNFEDEMPLLDDNKDDDGNE